MLFPKLKTTIQINTKLSLIKIPNLQNDYQGFELFSNYNEFQIYRFATGLLTQITIPQYLLLQYFVKSASPDF